MRHRSIAVLTLLASSGVAQAQLRVCTWNVTNYAGTDGRFDDFQVALYGVFEGRSLAPDVILGQEFTSASAVSSFLAMLNTASGGPADWAAAPFSNGNDTDNAFFYRTTRIQFIGQAVVAVGGNPPNHPRNVDRYDIRPLGYASEGATLSLYSSHMKSGSSSDDQARRLLEAQRIRDDAQVLPVERAFILGGDFNIQSSTQAAYQELVGVQANNHGRFFDPINTPGSWNNSAAFRLVHTQDPTGAGGMDDRHDQLLVSSELVDGAGFDYDGDASVPYSTSTWDDPNHSYRAWGNDGTSFDAQLRVAGNSMVGPVIAQALRNTTAGGHLPVMLDLLLPPRVGAPSVLDFGVVDVGDVAQQSLSVENAGDVGLWTTEGINDLHYTLTIPDGFNGPAGPFIDAAGGGSAAHVITMDTGAAASFDTTIFIASDDPDVPLLAVRVIGEVVASCPADLSGSADPNDAAYGQPDGAVDSADFFYYLDQFVAGDVALADLSGSADPNDPTYGVPDGAVDSSDFFYYLDIFVADCP